MITVQKATLTQYKGVVYKSKTEAMFARYLDITMMGFFQYEPFTYKNWTPDFISWHPMAAFHQMPGDTPRLAEFFTRVLYEYKPSKPTETYCKNLQKKFNNTEKWLNEIGIESPIVGKVYYGSTYYGERGIIYFGSLGLEPPVEVNWIGGLESAIADYRYDLEERNG